MKNIDKEINHLLYIKEELLKAQDFISKNPEACVCSIQRYKFWQDNNLLKPSTKYYIAPLEIKDYIENFQG